MSWEVFYRDKTLIIYKERIDYVVIIIKRRITVFRSVNLSGWLWYVAGMFAGISGYSGGGLRGAGIVGFEFA